MTFSELINLFARYLGKINEVDVIQLCGLAKGSANSSIKIANTIIYFLGNQELTLSAQDSVILTVCSTQSANSFCYYVLSVDGLGTITTTKGTDNTNALPDTPVGTVAFGALKVTTDISTIFTSGLTALDAADVTTQYFDLDTGMAYRLINQAMRDIEIRYNLRGMKVRTSFTTSSGVDSYENPIVNYKELISATAYSTSGGAKYPLIKQAIEYIDLAFQGAQQGPPQYIAEMPASELTLSPDIYPDLQFKLAPIPDVAYTVVLTAYQYTPFLDGVVYSTNWWTKYYSTVLLYEALIQAEPFMKNDSRVETWKAMSQLPEMIKADRNEQFSGSRQYPTPPNVI